MNGTQDLRRGAVFGFAALAGLAVAALGVVGIAQHDGGTAVQQRDVALVSSDFDFNTILQNEVASLNSIFQTQAALAGVSADDIHMGDPTATDPFSFDTIDKANVNDTFASLLYGLNPAANEVDDPGSYIVYNGALTQFDNASNVLLYSVLNNGDLIGADDLFGSQSTIDTALATESVMGAAGVFFQAGLADIAGYFDPSGLLG